MKPHSVLGRMIFFFWRLNPLACIMEVILLAIAFVDGIWLALKQSLSASANSMSFWNHLRTTATAIQLLRVHGRIPEHWRAFIDSQRQSGAAHASAINDAHSPPLAGNPYHNNQLDTLATLGHYMNEPVEGIRSNGPESINDAGSYLDEPSPVSSLDLTEPQSTDTNFAAASPQNPSDVESGGLRNTQSEISSSIGSSRLIRNDLGRIVLGRAELVLDLVGTAGVVIVMIRLASVVIPIHVRLLAAFMVTSWAFVQILHLVSNRRDADLVDTEYLIRRTLELERKLNHVVIWIIFSLLLLPLFGYFTFVALFKTKPLPLTMKMAFNIIFFCYFTLIDPLLFQFLPRMLSSGKMLRCSSEVCPNPTLKSSAVIVFYICKLVFFFCFGWLLGDSIVMCEILEKPSALYYILPFSVIPCVIWAWVFLPGISFMRRSSKGYEWMRGVALFYNLVTTGFFFTGAMMMYDANETYKPNWLDWLGKFHRP